MRRCCLLVAFGLLGTACGGSGKSSLCEDKPECTGAPVTPFSGQNQMVIATLEIGDRQDGFDIDHDGMPDNKLSTVSALTSQPISDALKDFSLVVPMEFFDMPALGADSCVKFAVYLGKYKMDADGDGDDTADANGDCNDNEASINKAAAEIPDNGIDDNCNGQADETAGGPSTNTDDADADGVTIADGDCDDTNPAVKGATISEVCGDGLDNDCDGNADFGANPAGDPDCTPFDDTPDTVAIDPLSFNTSGAPLIVFDDGAISADNVLTAGPSLFSVTVPATNDINLDLRITCARIEATVQQGASGIEITGGRLGGVLDAHTLDQVRGLDVSDIGLHPEDSLLDAIFANLLGTLIGLKKNDMGCEMPDIDVDQDGLEAFCDSDPTDDKNVVDTCIDGDGSIVMDTMDASGNTIHCTEAKDADGNFLFADGISVELNFTTKPAVLQQQ